jgi:hypothetical protein
VNPPSLPFQPVVRIDTASVSPGQPRGPLHQTVLAWLAGLKETDPEVSYGTQPHVPTKSAARKDYFDRSNTRRGVAIRRWP